MNPAPTTNPFAWWQHIHVSHLNPETDEADGTCLQLVGLLVVSQAISRPVHAFSVSFLSYHRIPKSSLLMPIDGGHERGQIDQRDLSTCLLAAYTCIKLWSCHPCPDAYIYAQDTGYIVQQRHHHRVEMHTTCFSSRQILWLHQCTGFTNSIKLYVCVVLISFNWQLLRTIKGEIII